MKRNKIRKIPELPPPNINYFKIYKELSKASSAVGGLQGLLINIPNKFLLIDPLLINEALSSSRIEGTQATLEEVYKFEADEKGVEQSGKEEDIQEVINYREALKYAIGKIEKERQPIGENFIKEIHSILLDSTRGEKRDRGNLRRIQVYVGKPGGSFDEASYIPPPPTELPPEQLGELYKCE
ncbi:MAG: Fic/DOC family N-terminal domain-containing protein [Thermodesulfobacteriota bacterium]